jgi:transcriptional regulator with XRE-family HTH domain
MKIDHDVAYKDAPQYAKILKKCREDKGMTQKELAKKLDISSMQVSHFETGERTPRLDVFDSWVRCVGMEVVFTLKRKSVSSVAELLKD